MSNLYIKKPVGSYPEQQEAYSSAFDQRINRWIFSRFTRRQARYKFTALLRHINQLEPSMQSCDEYSLQEKVQACRQRLLRQGLTSDQSVSECFALIREMSSRVLGMRHHDCQLQGGWYMLNGMVAEMQTGEGKTLTATLPVSVMALLGMPSHVITVNDYLAQRDADKLRPLYQALGLSVGVVTADMQVAEKQQAYACDITYCTNKTLVFDYLRDRMSLQNRNSDLRFSVETLFMGGQNHDRQLLLRGLCFALLDEADSILIDEARTPLIISGQGDSFQQENFYQEAYQLACGMLQDEDFKLLQNEITLTEAGEAKLIKAVKDMGALWQGARRRRLAVTQALQAHHLFIRDQHYLVEDGKVVIIDEYTGRPMPDRFWGRGLQQLIEIKEDCKVTGHRETLAKISYQRFFRRYHYLAGMTGTAREIRAELKDSYALDVLKVPTFLPGRRKVCAPRIYTDQQQKWQQVVSRVRDLHHQQRPVLIGTRTLAASEQLSELLDQHDLPHHVLNARQNAQEAALIAKAGSAGQITIATNMAGRGTDIAVEDKAVAAGGLHVILTEAHTARRIDRQMYGRCARQGQPGSVEAIMALDDEILATNKHWLLCALRHYPPLLASKAGQMLAAMIIVKAQKKVEHLHYKIRNQMLRQDKQVQDSLGFSGGAE